MMTYDVKLTVADLQGAIPYWQKGIEADSPESAVDIARRRWLARLLAPRHRKPRLHQRLEVRFIRLFPRRRSGPRNLGQSSFEFGVPVIEHERSQVGYARRVGQQRGKVLLPGRKLLCLDLQLLSEFRRQRIPPELPLLRVFENQAMVENPRWSLGLAAGNWGLLQNSQHPPIKV